jgi:S1-C subfamily serine protease
VRAAADSRSAERQRVPVARGLRRLVQIPARWRLGLGLVLVCAIARAQDGASDNPFAAAIDAAQPRTVKIYAAGIGTVKSYCSGVVVSADGRIVTVLSAMLEDASVRVVLADGRRFPAKLVAHDDVRQLAELRIEATDLPHFALGTSDRLKPGDWVIAAGNPFKVADGPEPVSVAVGVLTERADLSARRRTQDFSYTGTVLLTDVIVATPGSDGGALVDSEGQLVGIIGKAVKSTRTNTFANYALPVEEVAAFLERRPAAGSEVATTSRPALSMQGDLGIRLMDYGGRTRPAYVERVRADSPAAAAGLRADDLILSVNGQTVANCGDMQQAMERIDVRRGLALVVKRREEVKTVEIKLPGEPP